MTAQVSMRAQVVPTKPTINTANTSCANWLSYKYLDDEDPGEYELSFRPCFLPALPYNGFTFDCTYSDGTPLPYNVMRFNSNNGKLVINAYPQNAGKYYLKLSSIDTCETLTSIYLIVLINATPMPKAPSFAV